MGQRKDGGHRVTQLGMSVLGQGLSRYRHGSWVVEYLI